MPSRDDYKYKYVTESDGTLPGASFRDQTEDFLNAIDTDISEADSDVSAAMAKAVEALAAAEAAQGAVATLDQNCLHKFGSETATGTKTFIASPVIPTQSATDNSTKAVNSAWVRQLFSLTGGFSFGEDGKVFVDFNSMDPAILQAIVLAMVKSGGGLAVDQAGQLYVDFDAMDPAIMRAVVLNMVQKGGGISVDQAGQLYVDFDNMPTDKFEAMLKSIHVPIWLTANKTFYVDGSSGGPGSDTITDGIGESTTKPFKSLQACVKYVTDNYNISEYTLTIRCKNVSTTEQVLLPAYNATSGHIAIAKYTSAASGDPSFSTAYAPAATDFALEVTGGEWHVYDADIQCTNASMTSGGGHAGAVRVRNYATLSLYRTGCQYTNTEPDVTFAGQHCIQAQNAATLNIMPGVAITAVDSAATKVVNGISAGDTSVIRYGSDTNHTAQLTFAGDFLRLVFASGGTWVRNAVYMSTVDTSGVTTATNNYYATNGGKINTIGGGETYFGSVGTGYVETSTYSWYK